MPGINRRSTAVSSYRRVTNSMPSYFIERTLAADTNMVGNFWEALKERIMSQMEHLPPKFCPSQSVALHFSICSTCKEGSKEEIERQQQSTWEICNATAEPLTREFNPCGACLFVARDCCAGAGSSNPEAESQWLQAQLSFSKLNL